MASMREIREACAKARETDDPCAEIGFARIYYDRAATPKPVYIVVAPHTYAQVTRVEGVAAWYGGAPCYGRRASLSRAERRRLRAIKNAARRARKNRRRARSVNA